MGVSLKDSGRGLLGSGLNGELRVPQEEGIVIVSIPVKKGPPARIGVWFSGYIGGDRSTLRVRLRNSPLA